MRQMRTLLWLISAVTLCSCLAPVTQFKCDPTTGDDCLPANDGGTLNADGGPLKIDAGTTPTPVDAGRTSDDAGHDAGAIEPDSPPVLVVDRSALQFGREFGSSTWVETVPQQSLLLRNLGGKPLIISSVTISGLQAFTLAQRVDDQPLPSLGQRAITVLFRPQFVTAYNATLTIASNAVDSHRASERKFISTALSGNSTEPSSSASTMKVATTTKPTAHGARSSM